MFKRQTTGSVVCPSCGTLVGVNDDKCYTCGRRNPGLWGFGRALRDFGNDLGFIPLVVYGCSVVYVLTLLLTGYMGQPIYDQRSIFSLLGPSGQALFVFGASGAAPVIGYSRWWTVLSAGWLHAGLLHIVFNMMMVRQLGPPTADVYGAARMVIIYVVGGMAGFILSSIAGVVMPPLPIIGAGTFTVGASAPIFGLLGGLMYYSRRGGSSMMRSAVMGYVLSAVMFGILMPGIDNYAHLGGFLGGYVAGIWLDPLKRERTDHFFIAAAALLASALAIVVSFVTSLDLIAAMRGGQ
jgi:rhomboid protease GluP